MTCMGMYGNGAKTGRKAITTTFAAYCTDPQGPEGPTNSITKRVRRGGSYSNNPNDCRAAYRNELDPATNYNDIGFRVALVHEEPEPDPEP